MTHYHRRQLITDLDTLFTQISLPYQSRKSALSYGRWDSKLNLIEIFHQNRSGSKCYQSMGLMKNSKFYLYPEEAIFMMQCSLLQVSTNEQQTIPISLNEAYARWLDQPSLTLQHLHVYQYLTRIGFILLRHRPDMRMIVETTEDLINVNKRKRNDDDNEEAIEDVQQIDDCCPIHSSIDCRREWFPDYTTEPPIYVPTHPRLRFPDHFDPVHIDWLPDEINAKVSNVQLHIYENKIFSPRPSYALLRSNDLRSHSTIYQRLSTLTSHSNPSSSSPNISFDMYTPRKNFRKTQPGLPDYHIQVKNGIDEFNFDEIYNEQQNKCLTAVVHHGDVSFYTFKFFDPVAAFQ